MDSVELIKQICKERKIPISHLEKECGFSNGYIRNLREGKLPADRLHKIAEYLGVTMDYLTTGKNSPKESITGKQYYFDDDTAEMAQDLFTDPNQRILFSASRGAKPEDLQMAADLLRRLKGVHTDEQ